MTSANIHTLTDLDNEKKTKNKTFKKSKAVNAEKYFKSKKFKKSDEWNDNVLHFKTMSDSIADKEDLVLVTIDIESKKPTKNVKWSRNSDTGYKEKQLWSWDKWEATDHDRSNAELGMLIKGDVAVIDWDTKESYDWFMNEFITDKCDNEYNIYTSNETHSGGHIIFKIDEATKTMLDTVHNKSKWLTRPDHTTYWNDPTSDDKFKGVVDLLKEASTGSPVVVKLPSMLENSKKKWVSKATTIKPLPDEFKDYMRDHIYVNPKNVINKGDKRFILELLNLIPKDINKDKFKSGEYRSVMMECLKQGVSRVDFLAWSKSLKASQAYDNHKQWVDKQWRWCIANNHREGRDITKTLKLVKRLNGAQYDEFVNAYVDGCKTRSFQRQFISLIESHYEDIGIKKQKIMSYMNKFFTFTTGMTKNLTYYREYDAEDKLCSVKYYQDKASFEDATDVQVKVSDEGDKIAVGKYWRKHATNSYHKVINRPFGIKDEVFSENLNTFCGYRMTYDPNYSNPSMDAKGDIIDDHFRNIICAGDKESIDWMRKYFYDMVFLGKRPKVAIFCCSVAMGSGKSMFINPFAKYVIGEGQSRVIQNFAKMCKDTFTDYYDDASFVLLEEIPKYDQAKYSEMYEEFKELITGDRQSSRKFQQAPTQIENNSTWWVNSNHPQGLQPEIAIRRFMILEVLADMVGDTIYFKILSEAVNDSDAWANWFHRKIIALYEEFKHCVVEPIAKHIPMTPLKKRILSRRVDNFTLFFKYLFYDTGMADLESEDPLSHFRNKKVAVKVLYQQYCDWKDRNDIGEDWCNNNLKFTKKLNQHFYMEAENMITMTPADIKEMKKKQKIWLEPVKATKGMYVTFTDAFLKLVVSMIPEEDIQKEKYIAIEDVEDFSYIDQQHQDDDDAFLSD